MSVRTAVIPVAGKGTRFRPVTKVVAKELLPLVDTPILHYIIQEAADAGIEKIVLVTCKGKNAIEDYFDNEISDQLFKKIKIVSIRQKNPNGLGHAIACARPAVGDEPFAVLLGDDVIDAKIPCTKQLVELHENKNAAPIVGVMEVTTENTSKYGIINGRSLGSNIFEVNALIEKPSAQEAPSRLAIPGRYILTPDIFDILEKTPPSVGGEIQLTDALNVLAQKRKLYALQFEGKRFDAGDRFGYLEANIHFALKRPELREQVLHLLKTIS